MSLKARITEEVFEGLDDTLKAEYVKQDDGSYRLDVEAVQGLQLADVGGLQKALQDERKTSKDLKSKLVVFRDENGELLDAESARDAIAKLDQLGDDASVDDKIKEGLVVKEKQLQDKFDAQEKQLLKKHDEQVRQLTTSNEQLTGQLQRSLIDQAAVQAISAAKGSVELLLPIVRGNAKMAQDESSGEFHVQIVDDSGTPRLSQKSGSGTEPMTIGEFVETLRDNESFGRAFDAENAAGSGAGSGDSGGSSKRGAHTLSYEDAKDPVKYRVAKEAAAKAGASLKVLTPA